MTDAENKQVMADTVRMVPKYCTSVQLGALDNGNIVLSMIYAESGDSPLAILMDRFIIDKNHAKQLSIVLAEAVNATSSVP